MNSYKQMLSESGLQIHPKQTNEMLNNRSVQQLIKRDDTELNSILANSNRIQKEIEALSLAQGGMFSQEDI